MTPAAAVASGSIRGGSADPDQSVIQAAGPAAEEDPPPNRKKRKALAWRAKLKVKRAEAKLNGGKTEGAPGTGKGGLPRKGAGKGKDTSKDKVSPSDSGGKTDKNAGFGKGGSPQGDAGYRRKKVKLTPRVPTPSQG